MNDVLADDESASGNDWSIKLKIQPATGRGICSFLAFRSFMEKVQRLIIELLMTGLRLFEPGVHRIAFDQRRMQELKGAFSGNNIQPDNLSIDRGQKAPLTRDRLKRLQIPLEFFHSCA